MNTETNIITDTTRQIAMHLNVRVIAPYTTNERGRLFGCAEYKPTILATRGDSAGKLIFAESAIENEDTGDVCHESEIADCAVDMGMVETADCEWLPTGDCRQDGNGDWYHRDSVVRTEDGQWWLEEDTVLTYDNERIHTDDSIELTLGNRYAGEYAHHNDYHLVEHDCEVWLESDEQDSYVNDVDGDWISRDDAIMIGWDWYHMESDEVCYTQDNGWQLRSDSYYCEDCCEWFSREGVCDCQPSDRIKRYHYHTENGRIENYAGGRWSIGFEVEKNNVRGSSDHGERVEPQPFFAGWETDSSCGCEGISNIYAMHGMRILTDIDNSDLIDEECDSECGGHVNVNRPGGLTLSDVRPYAGLFYALYRNRLTNTYSRGDKKLEDAACDYPAIRQKPRGLVEFRLVSRVKTRRQLKRRVKLFAKMADAIDGQWSFAQFVQASIPLIRAMLGNDASKVDNVCQLAFHFDEFLRSGAIHADIQRFLPEHTCTRQAQGFASVSVQVAPQV